jgi:hypothetical protein
MTLCPVLFTAAFPSTGIRKRKTAGIAMDILLTILPDLRI